MRSLAPGDAPDFVKLLEEALEKAIDRRRLATIQGQGTSISLAQIEVENIRAALAEEKGERPRKSSIYNQRGLAGHE